MIQAATHALSLRTSQANPLLMLKGLPYQFRRLATALPDRFRGGQKRKLRQSVVGTPHCWRAYLPGANSGRASALPIFSGASMKKPVPNITVSDHALVRFMERRFEIDLEPVRRELIAMAQGPAIAGAANFKTPDGTFCFRRDAKGIVISTFLKTGMKASKAGRGAQP